jgi:hypothetical protein
VNKRWTQRPEGSTWGDWGQDDQLGRLNLIGPEQVKKGIAEVREGKTFSLSLPLDYPGGQVINKVRFPPVLKPVIRNGEPYFNYLWSKINPNHTDIGSDDAVLLHTQYSTQWDSLAHRGSVLMCMVMESLFLFITMGFLPVKILSSMVSPHVPGLLVLNIWLLMVFRGGLYWWTYIPVLADSHGKK